MDKKEENKTKQDNKTVVLYTIHCKNCKLLERKLVEAAIPFETCEDIEVMRSKNFTSAPMLEVDGRDYTFIEAIKWLEAQN